MAWPVGVATARVILVLLNMRASASGCVASTGACVIADTTCGAGLSPDGRWLQLDGLACRCCQ